MYSINKHTTRQEAARFSGMAEFMKKTIKKFISVFMAFMLLVPHLGFLGACLGSPLAWILADVFLIPAYFRCRRLLMTRVHHIHPRA